VAFLEVASKSLYSYNVAIVPTTANTEPMTTKLESKILSVKVSLDQNIWRCAAAGNITLTDMVQIMPTKAHKKLKDGT
jgi:hypothetical protein